MVRFDLFLTAYTMKFFLKPFEFEKMPNQRWVLFFDFVAYLRWLKTEIIKGKGGANWGKMVSRMETNLLCLY